MPLHACLAWLAALVAMVEAIWPNDAAQHGSFSQSCTAVALVGYTLHAQCSTKHGRTLDNQLDLNLCVGIDHASNALRWSV